jgi:glycosyltransferase involved in cell wall biosynthesis
MRIAYFINQYPKVSHSFIRREILALERQGFEVQRIALRGWDAELVDAADREEQAQTRYVLAHGVAALLVSFFRVLVKVPGKFARALGLAIRMGWHADRPLPYHLVYLAEACRILPWLADCEVQHVHAHFATNSAEVVMLAHVLGGPPFSFTVHGPEEFDKPEFIHLGEKIRASRFVVAISSYGRSQLYRWVEGHQWPKIHVVHCGLEQAFHQVAPVPLPEAPRLICVGRLCEQKGQLLLIEAVHRLQAKGCKMELVLAGDGDMRPGVEELIARYDLGDHVRITGWISGEQVREEILAARGLVLPSFAEGLPVVLMEAMALRRPVITTCVAGIPELVRPGENGWIIAAGSIDALVEALEEFLAQPPDVLSRMGEAGYQRVLERHDIDKEAGKLACLFRELC